MLNCFWRTDSCTIEPVPNCFCRTDSCTIEPVLNRSCITVSCTIEPVPNRFCINEPVLNRAVSNRYGARLFSCAIGPCPIGRAESEPCKIVPCDRYHPKLSIRHILCGHSYNISTISVIGFKIYSNLTIFPRNISTILPKYFGAMWVVADNRLRRVHRAIISLIELLKSAYSGQRQEILVITIS